MRKKVSIGIFDVIFAIPKRINRILKFRAYEKVI